MHITSATLTPASRPSSSRNRARKTAISYRFHSIFGGGGGGDELVRLTMMNTCQAAVDDGGRRAMQIGSAAFLIELVSINTRPIERY